jgi:hypothetical protein
MSLGSQKHKHHISRKRQAEFEQRPDEDSYQWIARQLTIAKPHEAALLLLLRKDEKQQRVYEVLQLAKTERSARHTKWAMLATIPISLFGALFR